MLKKIWNGTWPAGSCCGTSKVRGTLARVAACDAQPIVGEGLKALLANEEDLEFAVYCPTLARAIQWTKEAEAPSLLLLGNTVEGQSTLYWMRDRIIGARPGIHVVIWGASVSKAEASDFWECGVRGLLSKTSSLSSILSCLRTVASGGAWIDDAVVRTRAGSRVFATYQLTERQREVLDLVREGLSVKQVAQQLDISPGTVEGYVKHIKAILRVRGPYALLDSSHDDLRCSGDATTLAGGTAEDTERQQCRVKVESVAARFPMSESARA